MFKNVVVVNKATYLFLCLIPVAVIKVIFYDLKYLDYLLYFGTQLFLSGMIAVLGLYFFIRFNTYSHLMNPNHPKEK